MLVVKARSKEMACLSPCLHVIQTHREPELHLLYLKPFQSAAQILQGLFLKHGKVLLTAEASIAGMQQTFDDPAISRSLFIQGGTMR